MRGVVVGHGDEPRRAYIRPEPGQGARDRAGGRLQQARQLFIGENSTTAERQLAKANAVEEPDWEADTGRVTSRVPGAQVATRFGRPVENDPDQQRVLTDPGGRSRRCFTLRPPFVAGLLNLGSNAWHGYVPAARFSTH